MSSRSLNRCRSATRAAWAPALADLLLQGSVGGGQFPRSLHDASLQVLGGPPHEILGGFALGYVANHHLHGRPAAKGHAARGGFHVYGMPIRAADAHFQQPLRLSLFQQNVDLVPHHLAVIGKDQFIQVHADDVIAVLGKQPDGRGIGEQDESARFYKNGVRAMIDEHPVPVLHFLQFAAQRRLRIVVFARGDQPGYEQVDASEILP